MNNAVTTSLPKNKTGIYASEIQKMMIPKTKEKKNLSTISEPVKLNARLKLASLANCLKESNEYRTKHSAFKVNVKNRRPLESVNVKLKEQQRPISSRTRTVSSMSENDEPELTDRGSPVRRHDEAYTDDYIQMKDSFKPSAIKRSNRATPSVDGSRYGTSFTRLSIYNDDNRACQGSSFTRPRYSTASYYERKQQYSDRQYLDQSRQKQDQHRSASKNKQLAIEGGTIDADALSGEHLKDSSETTIFTQLNLPTRAIDNTGTNSIPQLINELCDKQSDFLKSLKSQASSIKSAIYNPANTADPLFSPNSYQFKQMQFYKNNIDLHSQQNLEMYRSMMENLDEKEFLRFLKTYRETKTIPPSKQSLISFQSGILEQSVVPDNDKASLIDQEEVPKEKSKFMNMQTQSLSLENSYIPIQKVANKSSSFFMNYISNKLHVRNEPHNLTAIMSNIIKDREQPKSHFYKSTNFANGDSSKDSPKYKSEQRFRPVNSKLLNFPAFA